MIYIGIDIGKKGGIAVIDKEITVAPFNKEKYKEILNSLRGVKGIICAIEQVHAMPRQGVTSMFSFGENYGYIQGLLEANNIAYQIVPPNKWKKEYSVTSDKQTSIDCALRLFPNVSLTAEGCRTYHDGMAEALLIAEYIKRKYVK